MIECDKKHMDDECIRCPKDITTCMEGEIENPEFPFIELSEQKEFNDACDGEL